MEGPTGPFIFCPANIDYFFLNPEKTPGENSEKRGSQKKHKL
jgi:hypothetical protein